ncbi:hypothetical protein [Paenibacillus sp. IHBB 10380]|uniref:hypothetical protein n=1 Tax=Paenibacillus sp. IHBB 10380 TaxID=1566358 RepID=UPI0006975137|nr:hypothetical protein [Paenibacillus sp. IHBB 10380]
MNRCTRLSKLLVVLMMLVAIVIPAGTGYAEEVITSLEYDKPDNIEISLGVEGVSVRIWGVNSVEETKRDYSAKVEWSLSDDKIIKVEKGVLTPLAEGTVTLTAKYQNFQVNKQIKVTASKVVEKVVNLKASENSYTLLAGSEQKLPVIEAGLESGTKVDVSDKVSWVSTSNKIITIKDGKIKGMSVGKTTIKAMYSGKFVKVPVTVEQKIATLTVQPKNIALIAGKSVALKVTGVNSAGKSVVLSTKVKWVSSDTSVATIKGASVKGVANGTTTLTGSYQGIPITVNVSVVPKLLKLTSSTKNYSFIVGGGQKLPLIQAEYADGTKLDVSDKVSWVSTSTKVLMIKDGSLTAVSKGKAAVKATYLGKYIKVPVTVEQKITSLTVEPNSVVLTIGKTKPIKVTGVNSTGDRSVLSAKVNWVSSNTSVITVKGATIRAIGTGSATLTGSYQGVPVTLSVSVVPKG